jgi:hypothetical protein
MSEEEDSIFHPNDIIIRLSPEVGSDGRWEGGVHVGLLVQEETQLNKDDVEALSWLATLTVAALPLMEDNDRFRELLHKYAETIYDNTEKPLIEKVTDNVIKVNFKGD